MKSLQTVISRHGPRGCVRRRRRHASSNAGDADVSVHPRYETRISRRARCRARQSGCATSAFAPTLRDVRSPIAQPRQHRTPDVRERAASRGWPSEDDSRHPLKTRRPPRRLPWRGGASRARLGTDAAASSTPRVGVLDAMDHRARREAERERMRARRRGRGARGAAST